MFIESRLLTRLKSRFTSLKSRRLIWITAKLSCGLLLLGFLFSPQNTATWGYSNCKPTNSILIKIAPLNQNEKPPPTTISITPRDRAHFGLHLFTDSISEISYSPASNYPTFDNSITFVYGGRVSYNNQVVPGLLFLLWSATRGEPLWGILATASGIVYFNASFTSSVPLCP